MKIGYARVSTEEQHLDLQLIALNTFGCDRVLTDQGISGVRFDRTGLKEALSLAQKGDTLVVWRLDRLGRSLGHLVEVMSGLRARGVEFASLTESIQTNSPAGMFMFHMIAALAEFERSLISERTRAGVAAARQRGSKPGRPLALTPEQCAQAKELLRNHSETFVAETFHVHHRTLRRSLSQGAAEATDNVHCSSLA
ncbi:recombinase family protein [Trinickia acidisoli]|uniref:recombinase family protein n=1 Tax=Trinickia acidisoli TaxID=2767482 RepID=UPI001A8F878E|nr:recombinase family protein [Trinickia acidisoli]